MIGEDFIPNEDERFERLANAVILKAVHDYRKLRDIYLYKGGDREGLRTEPKLKALRRFFLSSYFAMMTKLSGEALLDRLDRE